MSKEWNNREITQRCARKSEPQKKKLSKAKNIERLNTDIRDFIKNGGVIKKLPPCKCHLDAATNKPFSKKDSKKPFSQRACIDPLFNQRQTFDLS